jgi:hypothetical protein
MKIHLSTKQKIISGIALATVIGVTTWAIVHNIKAKRIYKQLSEDLKTGKGESGTISDLEGEGGALNPNTSDESGSSNLLNASQIESGITNLKKWIGHLYLPDSDEAAILGYLKGLKNQAQVSQLAKAYQEKYGVTLLSDLATVDYTVGGFSWGTHQYLPDFKAAIQALPAK